jgi:hypothetical protein
LIGNDTVRTADKYALTGDAGGTLNLGIPSSLCPKVLPYSFVSKIWSIHASIRDPGARTCVSHVFASHVTLDHALLSAASELLLDSRCRIFGHLPRDKLF